MKLLLCALAACLAAVIYPTTAAAISRGDEIELGRKALLDLRPVGFVKEPALTQVGEALKEKVVRKDLPWNFWVLEQEKELNAFALPGGFVFITRRYYEMLDGDELAFVVGHEMTHIDKRHFEEKLKRAKRAQMYDILAGVIIGATKAGRGWGTVADIGTTAYFTKYSRKLEREADLGGYMLAKGAGFDARRAVSALSKLGADKKDPIFGTVLSTHPLLSSREERLQTLGKDTADTPPTRHVVKVAQPKWKPVRPTEEELKNRPGLAVRVIGEDGGRWDNKWREDFRRLLSQQIELAGKYDVRDEGRADSEKEPKLSDLQKKGHADSLLVVTVHEMKAETAQKTGENGAEVKARVSLSARIVDTGSGAVGLLEDTIETRTGRDILPTDEKRLYLDMTLTQAVIRSSQVLANRLSAAPAQTAQGCCALSANARH